MSQTPRIPLLTRPFYFVRHGETVSNLSGTIAGSADVPLTARGRLQAQAAAARLTTAGITAIYSSALARARDTADCIARAVDLPVTSIPELAERNWGELEGAPRASRVRGITPKGAETPDQFMQRVLRGLAQINSGGLPLVVAHSGVFRVLCRVLGIVESEAPVANASPIRFLPPAQSHLAWHIEMLQAGPDDVARA
jgi:2,3-bisphosphoglycerate-dependent phosphoglycerate mutase